MGSGGHVIIYGVKDNELLVRWPDTKDGKYGTVFGSEGHPGMDDEHDEDQLMDHVGRLLTSTEMRHVGIEVLDTSHGRGSRMLKEQDLCPKEAKAAFEKLIKDGRIRLKKGAKPAIWIDRYWD